MRHLWVLFALLLACTNVQLEPLPDPPPGPFDNKLTIEGDVCTSSTEDLAFPLRVVFLVDGSESMEVNDPPDPVTGETRREQAVRETSEELLTSGQDVKIAVIRFSSEAQPLTVETDAQGAFESYFTDDFDYIRSRLPLLQQTDRTTNYIAALAEAYAEIRDELTKADQESLALSSYHVIMLTDGIPDTQEGSDTGAILDAVEAILNLGDLFRVDRVAVNTALIASGNPNVDAVAEDLLQAMADVGEGSFRSFASGGELNFLFVDLSTVQRIFTIDSLVATNLNAMVAADDIFADSDGDGLTDGEEAEEGTNPGVPDTDGDGCRDGIEAKFVDADLDPLDPSDCDCLFADYCFDADNDGLCDSGCIDADADNLCDCIDLDADGRCDPENYTDRDGDGLVDCEELWSGTSRRGADTEGDGLTDFHEIRFGVSPDLDDVADDIDWDAVPNGEEVRTGTDPVFASDLGRYEKAYRYQIAELAQQPGRTCYGFRAGNITLTEVVDAPVPVGAWPTGQGYSGYNRVLVLVGEVPFDDRNSFARYRVACVQARVQREGNYRDPPSGRVTVHDGDFVDLSEFDAREHCLVPGAEVEEER